MTEDEAAIILRKPADDSTKRDPGEKNLILQGLMLLVSVDPEFNTDTDLASEHDRIYSKQFARTVQYMTEDQLLQMRRWGWFYSGGSWTHFS